MKKTIILGVTLALATLMMPSCNKNRFDYSQLNSVEGSGQWKLPIGSIHKTLGDVMGQMNENQMISYDEDGNLQVAYHFALDNIIHGSDFMTLPTMTYDGNFVMKNPYPYQLPQPIVVDTVFSQEIELNSGDMKLVMAKIKKGEIVVNLGSNIVHFQDITLRSNNLMHNDGSPWVEKIDPNIENRIDLSGVSLQVGDDNLLNFSYELQFQLYNVLDSTFVIDAKVGLEKLAIQQLSGYLQSYESNFAFDSSFSLPLKNITGQMKIVDASLQFQTKNTFDMYAELAVEDAKIYGGGATPSMIFKEYPVNIQVRPSVDYTYALDETFSLNIDTRYDAIRLAGRMVFNPSGAEQLVSVYDTSTLGIAFDAKIPMKFNIPGVSYKDTIDINLSETQTPDLIKEVLLNLAVNSELPFNLEAQLYTYDSKMGMVTDSLLTKTASIAGSFDGKPVKSEAEISVTQDRMKSLLNADKLIMRFGLNTDNHDVLLNLDDCLDVRIKADVIYGGEQGI